MIVKLRIEFESRMLNEDHERNLLTFSKICIIIS